MGASSALYALSKGVDVLMLDIGASFQENINSDTDAPNSLTKKVKKYFGQTFPYDFNQYLQIKANGFRKNWFTSKSFGGFSLVWGGTWSPFFSLNDPTWLDGFRTVQEFTNSEKGSGGDEEVACKCFEYLNSISDSKLVSKYSNFVSLRKTRILLEQNLDHNQTSQTNRNFDFQAWKSYNLIKRCQEYENFELLSDHFVSGIDLSSKTILLSAGNKLISCDKLILAAGPVANSALLLRNDIGIGGIVLRDTKMLYIPFLHFQRSENRGCQYPFSQFSIDFQYGVSKRKAYAQLYGHLESHISSFAPRNWFLNLVFHRLFEVISPFLGVVLIYLDSQDSEDLELEWLDESLAVRNLNNSQLGKALISIRNDFGIIAKELRIHPIWPFRKVSNVGDSYHLGASKTNICDDFGRLLENQDVGVAGSFALPTLEPGPITMTAMAQGVRLVESMLDQLPKSGK